MDEARDRRQSGGEVVEPDPPRDGRVGRTRGDRGRALHRARRPAALRSGPRSGRGATGARALRQAIAASDALLVAAPEYGHSLPGVLKNAIDWLIGSGELAGKVVAITASVPAPERGRQGLAALRQTLGAMRAMIVSDEPITRGPGSEETIRDVLRRLVDGVREARQGSG